MRAIVRHPCFRKEEFARSYIIHQRPSILDSDSLLGSEVALGFKNEQAEMSTLKQYIYSEAGFLNLHVTDVLGQ